MKEKEFLIGDGTVLGFDAYMQAITEGMIDKDMTLQEFNSISSHVKIEMSSIREEEKFYDEHRVAVRLVYRLLKVPGSRKIIENEWFGEALHI